MSTKKAAKKKASKKATQKTGSKRVSSSRASNGKAAVAKGRKFEDAVANLYRLLGAEVTQGVMICQKKVDVLAVFRVPGSSSVHRVIIECKDERKAVAQNQRVMEFTGLLDTARKTGEAESAEIITRVPWSEAAKGFALTAGVKVLTYSQKLSQLIDFTGYLKDLVDRFEKSELGRPSEPPLDAYYVDLSAERNVNGNVEHVPVVNTYIEQWLSQQDKRRHLAVLGEYGAGKSSLCLKVAHDLAEAHIKESHATRIPILINLREFTKTLKIEALITSFLDEECGVTNPRFKLFNAMNDAGAFLLIFDGFDEMAVRVDTDTLEANLQEIEKLAASPLSKVILTSRPEYFVSTQEERTALSPSVAIIRTRESEYEPINISPWNDKQVEEFLKKRVPLIKEATEPWSYYLNHIQRLPDLHDLSQRPVLLEMVVKTLPEIIKNKSSITLNNLYEQYLLSELRRQKVLKRRTLLLRDEARLSILKNLASDIFSGEIEVINYAEVLGRVVSEIKPPRDEQEAYTRDFLSSSFLIRRGNEYRFSHKSILDYLAATELIDEIKNDSPRRFGKGQINALISKFIGNYNPNQDTLFEWINSTRSRKDTAYLGGNAATLLTVLSKSTLAGKDLSNTNLTSANLYSADLRGVNFAGTLLNNVNLAGALFLKEEISSAIFSNTTVSFTYKSEAGATDFKNSAIDVMKLIEKAEVLDNKTYDFSGMSIALMKKHVTITLTSQVNSIDELEAYRTFLSLKLPINFAVYADELGQYGGPEDNEPEPAITIERVT